MWFVWCCLAAVRLWWEEVSNQVAEQIREHTWNNIEYWMSVHSSCQSLTWAEVSSVSPLKSSYKNAVQIEKNEKNKKTLKSSVIKVSSLCKCVCVVCCDWLQSDHVPVSRAGCHEDRERWFNSLSWGRVLSVNTLSATHLRVQADCERTLWDMACWCGILSLGDILHPAQAWSECCRSDSPD